MGILHEFLTRHPARTTTFEIPREDVIIQLDRYQKPPEYSKINYSRQHADANWRQSQWSKVIGYVLTKQTASYNYLQNS
jgi:ADP-heptose:LPS heptosyltransferase